jgi:hypothetical protein
MNLRPDPPSDAMAEMTAAQGRGTEDHPPASVPAPTPGPPRSPDTWWSHAEHVVRTAWAGLVAGLLAGFVIGGLGGRIAMRVVTLQTDPRFDRITTDDGAQVNEISVGGTLFLAAFTTLLGLVGALVYLIVRPALPQERRLRASTFATVTSLVGGSFVVHADGVDFTLLGQRWVSVAMFVGLLAAYGATTSLVVERLVGPGGSAWRVPRWVLPVPYLAVIPGFLILAAAPVLAVLATARHRGWDRPLRHTTVAWVVRLGLGTLTAVAGVDLLRTLAELA